MNNETPKNLEFILFFSLESCVLSLWSVFSTPVENVRQIRLFLQNKPNFEKRKIGLSSLTTSKYEK